MAVDARNILNYTSSDAEWRTFAQAIHDQFIAIGLTQTADTGQINLATANRPGAGSVAGYEIFRFNDTEQATLGCYIKVEYGTSSASGNTPGTRLNVGTGTNGAGTLTGAFTALGNVNGWNNAVDAVAQTRPSFASYAEGQLFLMFGQDTSVAGRGRMLYIGRPRSYDGTRTTDGLILWNKSGNAAPTQQVVRGGGGGPAESGSQAPPVQPVLGGQDDQVGANVAMFPMPFAVNGAIRWSSLFAYRSTAIAADAQQSVTVFGGAKNYRTLGNAYVVNDVAFAVPYL